MRSSWLTALAEGLLLCLLVMTAAHAQGGAAGSTEATASGSGLLLADAGASMATAGGIDLYLQTMLNGTDRGLAHFGWRDGQLWASQAVLRELGFTLPQHLPDPVRLHDLDGVQLDYDQARQSVDIMAPLALLDVQTTMVDTHATEAPRANTAPGLLLNYNLYGSRGPRNSDSLSAFTELRAFNAHGVLSHTMLNQTVRSDGLRHSRSVRLDTSWSASFPERLMTLTVGDILTAHTSWSRTTRLGGIQLGTNFALQPYNVTAPLPQFFGSATLPSQVELYVDGMRRYSGEVPTGPFQLDAVPGITGAGNAQVVLTNALGQMTTLDFSLYGAPQLLRAGLTDWSLELGFVRRRYGLSSFDYGRNPVASGTWRRGLSHRFTATAHAEATRGLVNAGAGMDWLLGQTGGVLSASAARSGGRGQHGSQLGLGYQWNNRRFNFSAHATRASSGYRDAAAVEGGGALPRLSATAQAGVSSGTLGNFGLGYTQLNYQGQTSRYASAYWSKSLGRRASLSVNANQNLRQRRDRSVFLTLTMSLGERTYASTGLRHDGRGNTLTASVAQAPPTDGGWGWRAQTQQGSDVHDGQAEIEYLGRYGRAQVGASRFAGSNTAWAGADGSLVLMGGGLFPARQIYNSFAVVSTDGTADVPVKLENNPVGHTNGKGLLLVTPLNAYERNKVSIDPMNLPANLRISEVDQNATPTDRAGTLVRFGITPVRAAIVVLHDGAGQPLALGSRVHLQGQDDASALVGFDGEVYFDTLQQHNSLQVQTPKGTHCSVMFDYPEQSDAIPRVGPLACR